MQGVQGPPNEDETATRKSMVDFATNCLHVHHVRIVSPVVMAGTTVGLITKQYKRPKVGSLCPAIHCLPLSQQQGGCSRTNNICRST